MRLTISSIFLLSLAACAALCAQEREAASPPVKEARSGGERVVMPFSGIERPEDLGWRSHTHFLVHIPAGRPEGVAGFTTKEFPAGAIQPITGDVAETPASLACLYGLQTATNGCSETAATAVAEGGQYTIAIVDAYDYPTALANLTAYSSQFGLPAPALTVVYAGGTNPGPDPNCAGGNGIYCWAAESAIDIEMAHAAAPHATIYLVEADSASNADLYSAVTKAIGLIQATQGEVGEVSMSWGGAEYASEIEKDPVFIGNGVVFFASTGDEPGVQYPSTSPNVIAVGGTSISRLGPKLVYYRELTWDGGGGGLSPYEPRPAFQNGAASAIVASHRGVPDVAAIANPYTPVWVYESYQTKGAPWNEVGGTSVAAPLWAGIVNNSGSFKPSSLDLLNYFYTYAGTRGAFRGVTDGGCGRHYTYLARAGWNQCTGNGAPQSGSLY